jgi:hypothetical protein
MGNFVITGFRASEVGEPFRGVNSWVLDDEKVLNMVNEKTYEYYTMMTNHYSLGLDRESNWVENSVRRKKEIIIIRNKPMND